MSGTLDAQDAGMQPRQPATVASSRVPPTRASASQAAPVPSGSIALWLCLVAGGIALGVGICALWLRSRERQAAQLGAVNQLLNQEQLHNLINATPDIICLKDGEGRWLEANRADLELFQLQAANYHGKTDLELAECAAPIYRDAFLTCKASDEAAWDAGDPARIEESIPLIDGGARVFDVIKAPVFDEHGERRFLVVLGRDISERKAREARLLRFEEMASTTDDLMAFIDREYRYLQINDACTRAFGKPADAIIGSSLGELLGQETFRQVAKPRLDRCFGGEEVRYQEWFDWGRGRRFLDITYSPFREQGADPVSAVVVSGRDITAQKKGEEELLRHNRFLDFLSRIGRSFASSLDLDEVLGRVLREASNLLDITSDSAWVYEQEEAKLVCRHAIGPSAELMLGRRLELGVGITGQAAEQREILSVPDTRLDARHHKGVDQQTGVEIRSIIALPLLYQNRLQGVLVCVDILPNRFDQQDQQLLEALAGSAAMAIHNARQFTEMVKLRDQADAANRAKSAFLANMSHELRTPLNAVLGYAQILLKDPCTPPEQMKELNGIYSSGNYLLLLINDILDLAKIEAGRFELFPAAFDPRILFQQTHEQFLFKARQKGLHLELEGVQQLPPAVALDEKRLRQILMNLLSNAVKFTEQGKITLAVDYQPQMLSVEITDTGIGIAEGDLVNLFSPYSQSGEAKYRRQGTGLGLTITKSLVERMGGAIEVRSRLGEGSHFRFSIPAPLSEGAMRPSAYQTENRVIGYQRTDQDAEPLHLLVVDDENNNRLVMDGLLTPLGFSVDLAESGEEALRKANARRPDLVLMDIVMPRLDGLETTRRLLASRPGLPVVAVTAMASAADREAALAAGCLDRLAKPIQWEDLIEVLGRYLPLAWRHGETPSSPLADGLPGKPQALDLRALSPEQRDALETLLTLGRGRDLNRFVDQIEPQHGPLARQLRERLADYDYDAILVALAAPED